MTRFELKHTGDKDEVFREWKLLRDCINTRAEERNNINSYSLLMFFQSRKPLRIRETHSQSISPARTDRWLKLWAETGIGTLNIKTSPRETLKELWPARRTIGGEPCFIYFDGYFGNHNLWESVCEARRESISVPDTIVDWFVEHNIQDIFDDITIDRDETGRNFKFTTWKHGELHNIITRNQGEELMEGPPDWGFYKL
jgi:hypothetical protein|tara:strand:+ start:3946 stop:4542 length:597 start_codon:yes stop_codon:yes gene_type:complete